MSVAPLREAGSDEPEPVALARELKEALTLSLYDAAKKAAKSGDSLRAERYAILASTLSKLQVEYAPGVLAGINRGRLYVGEMFVEQVARRGTGFGVLALLHEAMHHIHGHDVRGLLAEDKLLYNIAADLYVNERLASMFPKLMMKYGKSLVRLESLPKFVEKAMGRRLSREAEEALLEAARLVRSHQLSTEQLYLLLLSLSKGDVKLIRELFEKARFNGNDLGYSPAGGGGEEEEEAGTGEGEALHEGDGEGAGRAGDEAHGSLYRLVERVRRELSSRLEEVEAARASAQLYKAVERGESGVGSLSGVLGSAEARVVEGLVLDIESILSREYGSGLGDPRWLLHVSDRRSYWLPRRVRVKRPTLYMMVDVSASIPEWLAKLMTASAYRTAEAYNTQLEVAYFSVGIVKVERSTGGAAGRTVRVPLGIGTVWESSVAKYIREVADQGGRLIVLLSDMYIDIEEEAWKAIMEFKNRGGKISCWSTSGSFLRICDYQHTLPVTPPRNLTARLRSSNR